MYYFQYKIFKLCLCARTYLNGALNVISYIQRYYHIVLVVAFSFYRLNY